MNWKTITDWFDSIWRKFIDSLGTPITPVPTPIPIPTPVPIPTPDPIPVPVPGPVGVIVVADMDLIPDRMRKAGFEGRDGALYYALAVIYGGGDSCAPASDGETALLFQRRAEIYTWWDNYLYGDKQKPPSIKEQLKANSNLTAKVIEHDGKPTGAERLGCRLVGPTIGRLAEFRDRVQPGDVFPEEGYA